MTTIAIPIDHIIEGINCGIEQREGEKTLDKWPLIEIHTCGEGKGDRKQDEQVLDPMVWPDQ